MALMGKIYRDLVPMVLELTATAMKPFLKKKNLRMETWIELRLNNFTEQPTLVTESAVDWKLLVK